MNDEARKELVNALMSLKEAKKCLSDASSNAENGRIRERIESQINSVEDCLEACADIANGFSQH